MDKKIILKYQYYCRQNFSAEDYFQTILESIDPSYKYSIDEITTIYIALDLSEVSKEKEKGRMIYMKSEGPHSPKQPFLVIKELSISFNNLTGDLTEIKNHILSLYGSKITKIQLVEEELINPIF